MGEYGERRRPESGGQRRDDSRDGGRARSGSERKPHQSSDRPSYSDRNSSSGMRDGTAGRTAGTDRSTSSDRSSYGDRSGAKSGGTQGSGDRRYSNDRRSQGTRSSGDERTRADRPYEAPRRPRRNDPEIPEGIEFSALDREVRSRLRGLSKEGAEAVGLHLVAAGLYLEDDPELAYRHAEAAVARGGRIDVVREAAGIAAYRTERFAEALRELRTYRRLSGSSEHLPVMADCERGLGRPDRAVAMWSSEEAQTLEPAQRVELALVVAGARAELDQVEAGLAVLDEVDTPAMRKAAGRESAARLDEARVDLLVAAGRQQEADRLSLRLSASSRSKNRDAEVVVFEVEEDEDA